MGAEFSILKRRPRESYYLGTPRNGYPDGMDPPPMPRILRMGVRRDGANLNEVAMASTRWSHPGWAAMWDLMDPEGTTRVFRLDGRTKDEIADLLYIALQIKTRGQALAIADDLQRWADEHDLVLNCDGENMDSIVALGFARGGYKETGSVTTAGIL